ncbi:Pet127-domain-containing protein [Hortaea werneckii]|nr:Pet127-domain-containing protein [Hortaea werneckii]
MYRALFRHRSWGPSGYVCRSCRHHRGLVASQAPQKAIDAREADATDDDLLDNPLNDINEEYGSHTRPVKVRKANEDAEKPQTTKDKIRERQAQDGASNFQVLKSSLGQRVQSPEDVVSLEGDGVERADQRGAKFDKIVAELRNEVPGTGEDAVANKILEAVDGQDGAVGDSSGADTVSEIPSEAHPSEPAERPVFSHTPGTDDIHVPPGQVSSQLKPTRRVEKAENQLPSEAREQEPEDTMLGVSRPLSVGLGPARKSLWQKVQETKLRPQWGGSSAGNSAFTSVDFESLRAADKRSPEPLFNTAGATRAWGGELSAKIAAEGDLDAEGQRSHLEQRKYANLRISKFMASGFEELKKNLASRVELPARQPQEERAKKRENVSEEQNEMHAEAADEPSDEGLEDESNETQSSSQNQDTKLDKIRARRQAYKARKEARKARKLQATQETQTQEPADKLAREPSTEPTQEPSNKPEDPSAMSQVTEHHQESEPLQSTLPSAAPTKIESTDINSFNASDLVVNALNIEQPPVLPLQYGLDRALFNQGVYQLQDAHSRVYNFDPYLQKVMPITEFDFNALQEYKASSQDKALSSLAKQHGSKFIGSTSSMTGTLAHFHFLISNWRELNLNMLSRGFGADTARFTNINRAPNAIFLRHKNGTYAIDADKEHDSPNVLMMLGKSMEKLLTLPKEQYERYRKGSENPILEAEKDEAESYEYTTMGNFLMRSQLDAYDSRLPGTGTFDLKTRAVVSIRMDAEDYGKMLGYEIHTLQGKFESYEREYYDMLRSTMLKYMLQARMGRMDGIFVAYHNIERIFGFQYLPISEMDRALHGQVERCLGDQEFKASVRMMDEVLQKATDAFPGKSLRLYFETTESPMTMMWIFAEPMEEHEIDQIQNTSKERVSKFEQKIMGIEKEEKEGIDASASANIDAAEKKEQDTASESAEPQKPSYNSSSSPADPAFFNEKLGGSEENLKPLFAATLICQNWVNGAHPEDNTVRRLHPSDTWEIQYILKEANMPLAEKWARYEDCKTRRKKTHAKYPDGDEGEEASGEKKESRYIRMLREMSARGREFRGKLDKMESGKEKVVLGSPITKVEPANSSGAVAPDLEAEQVKDTDAYLNWLYGRLW